MLLGVWEAPGKHGAHFVALGYPTGSRCYRCADPAPGRSAARVRRLLLERSHLPQRETIAPAFLCDLSSISSCRISAVTRGRIIGIRIGTEEKIPERWREIATAEKELLAWGEWSKVVPPPQLPKGRQGTPPGTIRSSAAERTVVLLPLATTDGIGIEGARLRMVAWPFRREYGVTATLEVEGGKSFTTIARIDAWPSDPHDNTRRDICRRLGIPVTVESHHIHRFEDNALIGLEAFSGNLPIARPIHEATLSFKKFLAVVEREFRVRGLQGFPCPPTWEGLL